MLVDNRVENDITVDRKISSADRKRVLEKLSAQLGVPVAKLEANLNDPRISPYTPVPVATDVTFDKLAWVAEHKAELPGVRAEAVPVRQYPNNSLASHLLGYVGEINEAELKTQQPKGAYALGDMIGKSGVELSYESDLRGRAGVRRVEVDAAGRVIRTLSSTPSVAGHDVRLTLDSNAQRTAETALQQGLDAARHAKDTSYKKGFKTLAAPAGAVVVLDAATGSVVAMASKPDYDPNTFVHGIPEATWKQWQDKASGFPLLNRAVAGQYAPGSTFKLMTAIAGLTANDINATRTINDTGSYAYATDPDHPFKGEGAPGRVGSEPRPRGVERRLLLHGRRRPVLPLEAPAARRRRPPGHRQELGIRRVDRHRPAERGGGPHPRRDVEAADPRREPGRVPVSRLVAGRQHPLGDRSGRRAGHADPTRVGVRDLGQRWHQVLAPARRRGAGRAGPHDPRRCRRSTSDTWTSRSGRRSSRG